MIDKNRMIAFTDAIIAVAATVMVLKLNIPDMVSLSAAREQFPTLIAYLISFVQIFLVWHEHHDLFHRMETFNHRIFLLNMVWLFFVTLLPFVTGIVGQAPGHAPSVLLYIGLLTLIQLMTMFLGNRAKAYSGEEMLDRDIIHKLRIVTFVGYALAAILTVVEPRVSMAVILVMSLVSILWICHYDRTIDG